MIDVYIINVYSETVRRRHALALAKSLGFPPARVNVLKATTPTDISRKGGHFGQISDAEASCFMSHLRVWSQAYVKGSHDWVLVLEDDARLAPGVTPHDARVALEALMKATPKSVHTVHVGPATVALRSCNKNNLVKKLQRTCLHNVRASLTHAYLIRKGACRRWVEEGKRARFAFAVDHLNRKPGLAPGFCVSTTRLFAQKYHGKGFESLIAKTRTKLAYSF
jgi:GR25 family glycosyltransferase involved in LPS biosynthesis